MTVPVAEATTIVPSLVSSGFDDQPFAVTGTTGRFDITAAVKGGGPSAQAGAVRLAIARALVAWQADYRPALSTEGLLTRDPRMVERKKYGIRGARRRPQWTKR